MRSSWFSDPRCVWNTPPAMRMIWCMRPLGSVSCTWSPAANGPRWVLAFTGLGYWPGGGSDAREDLVQVLRRQHADDLTGRLDQEVLGSGGTAPRVGQRHALQVGAEDHAWLDRAGHRPRLDPGAALGRCRGHGRL